MCYPTGISPDLVIGDFDSIENDFERRMLASTKLMVFPVDKNHTDGELALAAAVLHSLGEKSRRTSSSFTKNSTDVTI